MNKAQKQRLLVDIVISINHRDEMEMMENSFNYVEGLKKKTRTKTVFLHQCKKKKKKKKKVAANKKCHLKH